MIKEERSMERLSQLETLLDNLIAGKEGLRPDDITVEYIHLKRMEKEIRDKIAELRSAEEGTYYVPETKELFFMLLERVEETLKLFQGTTEEEWQKVLDFLSDLLYVDEVPFHGSYHGRM